MRIVTETVKSWNYHWLLVLSNIFPINLRRLAAPNREWNKATNHEGNVPIYQDILDPQNKRLKSRNPILSDERLRSAIIIIKTQWETFVDEQLHNRQHIIDSANNPPGFELPRRDWRHLNRVRNGHSRCNVILYKWDSQTQIHVIFELLNK